MGKKPQSLRQSSGRKPGGQFGHGGSTLKLVKEPDVIVEHSLPSQCDECGAALSTQIAITVCRQVCDLLRPLLQVTEHRGYEAHCACGRHHCSEFPPGVSAPVQASIGQAAQQLAAAYERIAQAASAGPVVHFDKTGQRNAPPKTQGT